MTIIDKKIQRVIEMLFPSLIQEKTTQKYATLEGYKTQWELHQLIKEILLEDYYE